MHTSQDKSFRKPTALVETKREASDWETFIGVVNAQNRVLCLEISSIASGGLKIGLYRQTRLSHRRAGLAIVEVRRQDLSSNGGKLVRISNPSLAGPAPERSSAMSFNLAVISIRGNVSVAQIVEDTAVVVKEKTGRWPLLLLGPTAPTDLSAIQGWRAGWVTFLEEVGGSEEISIISPHSLLEISLFIEKNTASQPPEESVVVGDFLDNVLCAAGSNSLDAFFSFYCQLAARVKRDGRTAILVVKEDLHDSRKMEIVRRFADIIVEYRSKEDGSTIIPEMRILDFANSAFVNWTSEDLIPKLRTGLGNIRRVSLDPQS